MSTPEEMIGRYVEARYANDFGVHAEGRVVAYSEAPSFIIETPDGRRISWLARLTQTAEVQHSPRLGDRVFATWRGKRCEFVWAAHETCQEPGWVHADTPDSCVADAELTDIRAPLVQGISMAEVAARIEELNRQLSEGSA